MPLRLTPSCEGTLPADRVRAYLPKICLEQYSKGVATTLFVFWNHNMHFVKVPPQVFDSNNPTLRPSWMWAGRYTDCVAGWACIRRRSAPPRKPPTCVEYLGRVTHQRSDPEH